MSNKIRNTDNNLVLVIGGTGKTGRRVVERLKARQVPTRIGSRYGTVPFDWENKDTWQPALQDVHAAYITYFPDLAAPTAPEDIRAFSDLAVQSGVKRLVLLSGRGEMEALFCEGIVQQCGTAWTIVRASWFNQNFSESFMLEPLRLDGLLALPAGNVKEPFIDVEDIADVAVAALTEDGHTGQVYEVTGPRLLTFAEAIEEIAQASGRELKFQEVPIEQYVSDMQEHDVPQDVIKLTKYLFNTILDGRNSRVTDGIQRALGRAPRDFSDYARATAATGVWNGESCTV
jgi:uncharacterized protein YbjT (DUF2867 family)